MKASNQSRNNLILTILKEQTKKNLLRPKHQLRAEFDAREKEMRDGWLGISDWLIENGK